MLLSAITNLLVSMDCLACLPFRSLLSLKRIEILQETALAGIALNNLFFINEIHGILSQMISFFLTIDFYRPQRSCEGYVFTGVCLSTGGGGLVPGGCLLRGVVGIPACTEADPLRERQLLLRTVRILLECILFFNPCSHSNICGHV